MVRGETYCYVRMPRSGSSTIAVFLSQQGLGVSRPELPSGKKIPIHTPCSRIPPEMLGGRRMMGTVRNPYDWYKSFFRFFRHFYHLTKNAPPVWMLEPFTNSVPDFDASMKLMLCKEPIAHLDEQFPLWGEGMNSEFTLGELEQSGIGLCSFLYCKLYLDALPPKKMLSDGTDAAIRQWHAGHLLPYVVLDTYHIDTHLPRVLSYCSCSMTRAQRRSLGKMTRRGDSDHGIPADLTEEHLQWISEKDRLLTAAYGYRCPRAPARDPGFITP